MPDDESWTHFHCGLHGRAQLGCIAGFLQKCDGTETQALGACLIAAMSGQNDDGHLPVRGCLDLEKAEATHAGHSQVEYQAAGIAGT